uniref:Uncharacterized protein n=1 Tax=Anguilla anguilla TaxID=7936 RepID=A0A0E9WTZ0_ANGAN
MSSIVRFCISCTHISSPFIGSLMVPKFEAASFRNYPNCPSSTCNNYFIIMRDVSVRFYRVALVIVLVENYTM